MLSPVLRAGHEARQCIVEGPFGEGGVVGQNSRRDAYGLDAGGADPREAHCQGAAAEARTGLPGKNGLLFQGQ